MNTSDQRVKVLLISGFWRSGSTILTRVLNELDGTFAAGGLETIWKFSYIENGRCGCQLPFRDCPVWQQVTEQAFGSFDGIDARWLEAHKPRMRHLPVMLAPGGERVVRRRFAGYIDALDRLYASTGKTTSARVIVDSSKPPPYAHVLGLVPSVDLYTVHLVRDPHGVQYSILRRKQQGDPRFQSYSVRKSTLMWNALNVSEELLGRQNPSRYMRLRYEDFVQDPIRVIEDITTFIGEPDLGLPTFRDGKVLLTTNHTVNGSENRTESGEVPFRRDDKWRTEMEQRERSLVTRLSYPLLRRYGYA